MCSTQATPLRSGTSLRGAAAWQEGSTGAECSDAAATLTLLVEEQVGLEDLVQIAVIERCHGRMR